MRLLVLRSLLIASALAIAVPALAVDAKLKRRARDADAGVRGGAARDLAKDGSRVAGQLLRRLLTDEHPWVCDKTTRATWYLRNEEGAAELVPLARAKTARDRWNGIEALGRTRLPMALDILEKYGIADGDRRTRHAAVATLALYEKNARALEITLKAFEHADPLTRAGAVNSSLFIGTDGFVELISRALDDPDPAVRTVALRAMPHYDKERAAEVLPRFVKAADWRERFQATEAALVLRTRGGVDALVKLVGDARARVAVSAHRSLRLLSGVDYGRDAELWRSWWKGRREEWKAPEGKLSEPSAKKRSKSETYAQFHGVDVVSDAVVFVLDGSGSMSKAARGDAEGRTRWQVTTAELEQALAGLPDGARVNLFVFNERLYRAFDAPHALDEKVRKTASTFLRRFGPSGDTDVFGALEAALLEPDVDTVFLLGDGIPTAGDAILPVRVRAEIARLNTPLRRAIHTILIGTKKESAIELMRDLASDSGGTAVRR